MNTTNEFEGIYGPYSITQQDIQEVQLYRISVLICGLSFSAGLIQWIFIGPQLAWICFFILAISLGFALKWIHIYIRELHRALQLFWLIGCIGIGILTWEVGSDNLISMFTKEPISVIAIGPLFVSLTGLGFKEFFCFRRLEAIGLTILVPIALLGHLSKIINGTTVFALLSLSAILLLIMAVRKFGMSAASDIGDKSVFEYLERKKS
tara:strand:- start:295 stop:918 length:624 start_codon:yes stop_codon:yes gene_type:complete